MWCVQNELPEGKGTVGVEIASSHLAPTPVGMKITATAEVTGVSANGKMITFKVSASDEDGLIGEGTHTRAVIDNARFQQKCSDKLHKVKIKQIRQKGLPVRGYGSPFLRRRGISGTITRLRKRKGGEHMRVLATIAFSFAAGLFLVLLLPWSGWYLWAAAGLALAALGLYLWGADAEAVPAEPAGPVAAGGVAGVFHRGIRRCSSRCWTSAARRRRLPAPSAHLAVGDGARRCGDGAAPWDARGQGYVLWRGGAADAGAGADAVRRGVVAGCLQYPRHRTDAVHGPRRIRPALSARRAGGGAGAAQESSAGCRFERRGPCRRGPPPSGTHQSVQGFLIAELTGDRAALPEGDAVVMEETGLAHLFAVSGLHCAFLVTLLGLLTPGNRRRTLCAVTIPALLFYMVMVGLSPSVVRACIMQIFLLTAPLFRRSSDGLTALAAALGVILLANPFTAGSVSLQLSFAAALGMVLLTPRLYQTLSGWYHGQRRLVERMIRFLAANLAATLGSYGVHRAADRMVLQHLRDRSAAGRTAGGARRGLELHGGLHHHPAGRLLLAAAGAGAGLGVLRAGEVHPVGGADADGAAVPRRLFQQPHPHLLDAVQLYRVHRLRRHEGPAAEVRHGGGAVGDDAGGVRMAGRYRPVRCHERPGAGCGGRARAWPCGPAKRRRWWTAAAATATWTQAAWRRISWPVWACASCGAWW